MKRVHSASPSEPIVGNCRAIRSGGRILVGGTAPIGPDGGNVAPGDPYAQAVRCLDVAQGAIESLGGSMDQVVRTRVYLVAAAPWREVGRAHGERFPVNPPVTTFVQVAALLDPAWLVEIEVEAEC